MESSHVYYNVHTVLLLLEQSMATWCYINYSTEPGHGYVACRRRSTIQQQTRPSYNLRTDGGLQDVWPDIGVPHTVRQVLRNGQRLSLASAESAGFCPRGRFGGGMYTLELSTLRLASRLLSTFFLLVGWLVGRTGSACLKCISASS